MHPTPYIFFFRVGSGVYRIWPRTISFENGTKNRLCVAGLLDSIAIIERAEQNQEHLH